LIAARQFYIDGAPEIREGGIAGEVRILDQVDREENVLRRHGLSVVPRCVIADMEGIDLPLWIEFDLIREIAVNVAVAVQLRQAAEDERGDIRVRDCVRQEGIDRRWDAADDRLRVSPATDGNLYLRGCRSRDDGRAPVVDDDGRQGNT